MADQSIRGRFVWHELTTPDQTGAHTFYSKAIGWKTERWEHDPSYSMFVGANGPLGGAVESIDAAPRWLAYIATEDVAATVAQAKGLGGRLLREQAMPDGGSYAVLTDPQGAQFGVYASARPSEAETAPRYGEFSWHELAASDYKAAFKFYAALFGWERIDEHDMGPLGMYFIFGRGGTPTGGIYNKPADMKGDPNWMGYVRVKDVNQVVNKVKSARGALINGPMEVPGGDWIAQFLDPYGAGFAAHMTAADVKPAAGAASGKQPASAAAPSPASAGSTKRSAASAGRKKPAKKKTRTAPKPVKKAAAKKSASAAKAAATKKRAKKRPKKAVKKTTARKGAGRAKAAGRKRAAAKSARRPARKMARGAKKAVRKPARKAARKK